MNISSGDPKVKIGVIDGPIDLNRPHFHGSRIRTVKDSQTSRCRIASSIACMHGTFVIGILASKRGSKAPGICPNCEIILYPIFKENNEDNGKSSMRSLEESFVPSSTPEELSNRYHGNNKCRGEDH